MTDVQNIHTRNDITDATEVIAGEIVYFSNGWYSDYYVSAVARVLRTFRLHEFIVSKQASWDYRVRLSVDVERLTREGYIEELPAREIHITLND